jgi:dTDP-glucose pyrophosphorylase
MNILITMAGDGRRFQEIGFRVPKHEISVRGKSLFEWSMKSLENFYSSRFFFVTRKEHNAKKFVESKCARLGIRNCDIFELEKKTSGQAETALLVENRIDPQEPCAIFNIDTYVEPAALHPEEIRGDGWIPVFKAPGDRWSFCKTDSSGKVLEIAEKNRISDLATIGFYYFSSFALFKSCYESFSFREYKEKFVAPLYAELLGKSKFSVFAPEIDAGQVHVLGTPEDVREFCPEFA